MSARCLLDRVNGVLIYPVFLIALKFYWTSKKWWCSYVFVFAFKFFAET